MSLLSQVVPIDFFLVCVNVIGPRGKFHQMCVSSIEVQMLCQALSKLSCHQCTALRVS